jgi:Plasmid pRiA4b ORF-3-like protein
MARKKSTTTPLVPWWQVRIELLEVTPRVWRRVLLPEDLTLPRLHYVVQACMGWTHGHLHEFVLGGRRYSMPDPDFSDELEQLDERRVVLCDAIGREARCFDYIYDFGDNWHHVVIVEDPYAGHSEQGLRIRCLDGENACPPEDVGGPGGYAEFLTAIADPRHDEHEHFLSWAGGSFDPAKFDITAVNELLDEIKT